MSDESKYNKFSGPVRFVADFEHATQPGDSYWHESAGVTYLTSKLAEDLYISIPVNATGVSPCWQWDGNRGRPTITPSVHLIGHWHGFITNGQIKSC